MEGHFLQLCLEISSGCMRQSAHYLLITVVCCQEQKGGSAGFFAQQDGGLHLSSFASALGTQCFSIFLLLEAGPTRITGTGTELSREDTLPFAKSCP